MSKNNRQLWGILQALLFLSYYPHIPMICIKNVNKNTIYQSMRIQKIWMNQKSKKKCIDLDKKIFSRFSLRQVNKFFSGIEQQIFFSEPSDIIVRNSKPNFLILVILSFKYSVKYVSMYRVYLGSKYLCTLPSCRQVKNKNKLEFILPRNHTFYDFLYA